MTFNFGPNPAQAPALRWGIVAPGNIANKFADNVHRYTASQVVAAASRSLERAQEFTERHNIPTAYGSYDELYADPNVDVVYVASPHSHHYEQALAALAAGKHILVEKSITQYAWQSREIFDEAKARGLFAMEAMWTRFLPNMYAIRQLIADGELGDLKYLTALHGQANSHIPRMNRSDLAGGALLDLGIYPIAFAQDILGVPEQVEVQGDLLEGVDATVALTFLYPSYPGGGAYAHLATTMMSRLENYAQIGGTKASIRIGSAFYGQSETILETVDKGITHISPTWNPPAGSDATINAGFEYQAAEVARRIHDGHIESPLRSWADTIASMDIIDAARHALGQRYPGE